MSQTTGYIQLSLKEKINHLIYWLMITAFLCFGDPVPGNLIIQFVATLIIMLIYMFVYYAQYLYIFPLFYEKNKKKVLLSILAVLIFYLITHYLNLKYIMTLDGNSDPIENEPKLKLAIIYLIVFAIVSVIAFGAYQNKTSILKIQLQSEKEKALLIKELAFFKNQFNSHITFNFLNYCYNYVHESSKEAGDAIQLFSEMLRYTMNTKPEEKVPLKNEIDYIDNFIRLKQLLSKGVCVELNAEGSFQDQTILPRLLITFVENAFKHGETHTPSSPIKISIITSNDGFEFKVSNKKK